MALAPVDLPIDLARPIPDRIARFLDDAAMLIDRFIDVHKDNPVAGFVPSDYVLVYRVLESLRQSPIAAGLEFCEWGSGMGVIADLASMLGFNAVGIEIERRLVESARELAAAFRLPVQFACGSYVPDDYVPDVDDDPSHVMTLEPGRAAYDELGLDPSDFDVIFAYPWPGEDDVVTSLFEQAAARGAVLLTFHGQDGVLLRRKVR